MPAKKGKSRRIVLRPGALQLAHIFLPQSWGQFRWPQRQRVYRIRSFTVGVQLWYSTNARTATDRRGCQTMILPFRGHGYLVVVFYVGAFVLAQFIVDSILGEGFYTSHPWPKYIAVAMGALVCWLAGRWLNSGEPPKRLRDLDTGEEFVLPQPTHEFLYLKVEYWGLLGAVACIVITLLGEFDVIRF